jgi:hypothetical protein
MALTPEGTPYVESTDLVANYPAASLSLANRVDLVGVLPFATSAARATAIPSPTDGQYSYLQDTNSTEFWNGSAWVAAGTAPGLVLVEPTSIANSGGTSSASGGQITFTTVSSISLNGVFTSTYDNYRIVATFVTSTNSLQMSFRYRVGGSDNTGATSYSTRGGDQGSFVSAAADTSSFPIVNGYTGGNFLTMESLNPFASQYSLGSFDSISATVAVAATARFGSLVHTSTTSFDGFTIFIASGSFTGKLRVYGYKNS